MPLPNFNASIYTPGLFECLLLPFLLPSLLPLSPSSPLFFFSPPLLPLSFSTLPFFPTPPVLPSPSSPPYPSFPLPFLSSLQCSACYDERPVCQLCGAESHRLCRAKSTQDPYLHDSPSPNACTQIHVCTTHCDKSRETPHEVRCCRHLRVT